MKTKRITATAMLITALFIVSGLRAQNKASGLSINDPTYVTAVGIRGGETSGLTIKHFFGTYNAVEGIIGFWPNSMRITGLYEKHVEAGVEGLNWYYGGGAHLGFTTGSIYYYRTSDERHPYASGETGIGIDGIVGIEYKIPPIPFALSFDLKPYFEFTTLDIVNVALDPGVGIKVAF